jgi:hypothetical protein
MFGLCIAWCDYVLPGTNGRLGPTLVSSGLCSESHSAVFSSPPSDLSKDTTVRKGKVQQEVLVALWTPGSPEHIQIYSQTRSFSAAVTFTWLASSRFFTCVIM